MMSHERCEQATMIGHKHFQSSTSAKTLETTILNDADDDVERYDIVGL